MNDLKESLVAGAIEAAEIITAREVRAAEDRLSDGIVGVRAKAETLGNSVEALRAVAVILSNGFADLPGRMRVDLAADLEGIKQDAAEAAKAAADEGTLALAETLDAGLRANVRDLGERLLMLFRRQEAKAETARAKSASVAAGRLEGLLLDLSHETERRLTAAAEQSEAKQLMVLEKTGRTIREKCETAIDETREAAAETTADVKESALAAMDGARTAAVLVAEQIAKAAQEEIAAKLESIPPPAGGPEGPPGPQGRAGVLGRVAKWERDRAWTEGAEVRHLGGVWRCREKTTEAEPHPTGDDWEIVVDGYAYASVNDDGFLIARRSSGALEDLGYVRGPEGKSPDPRGTYDPVADYSRLDVVIRRGTSYTALIDGPGECPGPDWKMSSQRGERGPAGKPGTSGRKGDPGPPGPIGEPAEFWRGRYDAGSMYSTGEWVHYDQALWVALRETDALPRADQINWDLVIRNSGGGGGITSGSVTSIVSLTQAEYDALSPPGGTTLYLICNP